MDLAASGDLLFEKKIEVMLDMAVKKLAGELGSIRSALSQLSEEVANMRSNVKDIAAGNAEPRQPVFQAQQAFQTAQQQFQQPVFQQQLQPVMQQPAFQQPAFQQAQPARSTVQGNQRVGNLGPEDVSIEKYFYCGGK